MNVSYNFSESEEILDKEMNKRIDEIEENNITRDETIEKEKLEYELKRTKFIERAREGNVYMALQLQQDLNVETKEDLINRVSNVLTVNKDINEALTYIEKVFFFIHIHILYLYIY